MVNNYEFSSFKLCICFPNETLAINRTAALTLLQELFPYDSSVHGINKQKLKEEKRIRIYMLELSLSP